MKNPAPHLDLANATVGTKTSAEGGTPDKTPVLRVLRYPYVADLQGTDTISGQRVTVDTKAERTPAEFTVEYIQNALATCRRYKKEKGKPAPRLGEWEALSKKARELGLKEQK